jgi:hypothetical protein
MLLPNFIDLTRYSKLHPLKITYKSSLFHLLDQHRSMFTIIQQVTSLKILNFSHRLFYKSHCIFLGLSPLLLNSKNPNSSYTSTPLSLKKLGPCILNNATIYLIFSLLNKIANKSAIAALSLINPSGFARIYKSILTPTINE